MQFNTRAHLGALLTLSWPIFIEQALRIATGAVDVFMVSLVSDEAVAAVGVANQLATLCLPLFNLVAIGGTVVISHCVGAGDRAGAAETAAGAVGGNLLLGVVASLAVFLNAAPLLGLMQLPPGLMGHGLPFLQVVSLSLCLEAINMSLSAILRGHGKTRVSMLIVIGQNGLNAIGNVVFIFGLFGAPKLGVPGVALATALSRLAASGALWIAVRRMALPRVGMRRVFSGKNTRLRRIVAIGLPAAGEHLSWMLGYSVVMAITARMGTNSLATLSYAMQLTMFVVLFSVSVGLGTGIMIGHSVGAGDLERAKGQIRPNMMLALGLTVSVSTVVWLLGAQLLGAFTSDPVIVQMGLTVLMLGVALEPGRSFNLVVINALRATGDVRFPFLVGLLSMWGLWVPLAWLLGLVLNLGLPGIWVAMIVDEWTRGLAMFWRWEGRGWMQYASSNRPDTTETVEAVDLSTPVGYRPEIRCSRCRDSTKASKGRPW